MVLSMKLFAKNVDMSKLSPKECEKLAEDPNTPAATLVKLAEDENWSVRWHVAKNTKTPGRVLTKLANDEDWRVLQNVAKNPSTPQDTLRMLAEKDVRIIVARNTNAPPDTLAMLAKDNDEGIRWYVAANPSTPANTLLRLADDESLDTGKNAVDNPSMPANALAKIYNNLVQKDKLDVEFAGLFVKKNVLNQTEVLALIVLYGKEIAILAANSVPVERGSLLEKVLVEHGYQVAKRPVEKGTRSVT